MQLSPKWWAYLIGFHVVRHLRRVRGARPDKQDSPIRFGSLVGDIYRFRDGVFRLKSPEGTVAIEDGPSGVLFSDIAGGFTMVECYEIPRPHRGSLEILGPKRFIEAFIEEILVPRRIAPSFGMPLLREGYLPTGCEPGTYYVDGTIREGSTFAAFSPDGSSDQLDLRLGLLATIREDRVYVFLRGVTPDLVGLGADDFEGIEEHLMTTMRSTRFQEEMAVSAV
ncbi:hypothetical protein ACFL2Z_04890 [Candidatus Eisenbacteria bacterium]|uniref:Uncharacterized protein n=1 Tax=Eiseniibacteriota bacterium TaxID=2212470 RepID=A0ABV6YQ85_UNCEI